MPSRFVWSEHPANGFRVQRRNIVARQRTVNFTRIVALCRVRQPYKGMLTSFKYGVAGHQT
jgi:hypothetical protein